MPRVLKVQHFESEGRDHMPMVIKNVKNYLRGVLASGLATPTKVIFFTRQGEGPMLAYNELSGLDVTIIAVMFPATFTVLLRDQSRYAPEMPEKVRKFFKGVEIEVIRGRLPFDPIAGSEGHNRDMSLLREAFAVFGGSMPLAIQAVLQATDAGLVAQGEEVIAVTADTAIVATASTTSRFLGKDGFAVNEIICKPRNFTITRPQVTLQQSKAKTSPEIQSPDHPKAIG